MTELCCFRLLFPLAGQVAVLGLCLLLPARGFLQGRTLLQREAVRPDHWVVRLLLQRVVCLGGCVGVRRPIRAGGHAVVVVRGVRLLKHAAQLRHVLGVRHAFEGKVISPRPPNSSNCCWCWC